VIFYLVTNGDITIW